MQILSTRSKVSSRRFYESFTSNKQCKSYVRDKETLAVFVPNGPVLAVLRAFGIIFLKTK
jgi:hypothetical protein